MNWVRIMDENELKTFLLVAKYQSFNRASQELFITPAAVMKQVNKLEGELHTSLFTRSHTGVKMTKAGELMIPEAKKILNDTKQARQKLLNYNNDHQVIRIGTSIINPATRFNKLWTRLQQLYPTFQFVYVAMNDQSPRPYSEIGKSIDIVLGPFNLLNRSELLATPIDEAHFTISMLASNILSQRHIIRYKDLFGMNVYTVPANVSHNIDTVRNQMKAHGIQLKTAHTGYSVNTFNQIQTSKDCLLSLDYWNEASPNIVSIPLATKVTLPIDVIINQNAPKSVQNVRQSIIKMHRQKNTTS